MIDETVSHYRILGKLGTGGMGVVYRAQDLMLKRPVALKFLPPEMNDDRRTKQRFLREARAAAALDHPNICSIYEIGEAEHRLFLAMACYEGETLKSKIERGPLAIAEAVDLARQVAAGLAAAHEAGIVHRDVKPPNIFVTSSGQAKILDFGVAKLLEDGSGLTKTGSAVGTPSYMSPEQTRGEKPDARTDLWSLGVVLYEMIAGRRPFEGSNLLALSHQIHSKEPEPLSKLRPDIPLGLSELVARLLQKEKDRRYRSCREVLVDLEALVGSSDMTTMTPPLAESIVAASASPRRRPWAMAGAVAVALALAVALGSWLLARRGRKVFLEPPMQTPFTSDGGWKDTPRISPNGERVAFAWRGDADNLDIYVKALGLGAEPQRLTEDPSDEAFPVFSPDGRQIAFVRISEEETALYAMPSHGGQERKLRDLVALARYPALSWSSDGHWLAFSESDPADGSHRIVALSLETLEAKALTSPPSGIGGDFSPEFSPDGRQIAFCRRQAVDYGDNDIWVQRQDGQARRLTFERYADCGGLAWTPDGREVVFANDPWRGSLVFRVSVGAEGERGAAVPLAGLGLGSAYPSIAEHRLVYRLSSDVGTDIWRIPARGSSGTLATPERLISSSQPDLQTAFSRDGSQIAFASSRTGSHQIWLADNNGASVRQLTNLEQGAGTPTWSPDGRRIAFDSRQSGNADLWVVDVAGGVPRQVTSEAADDLVPSWSRDGQWLYFQSDRSGDAQIWKLPVNGGEAVQVTKEGGFFARESLDGKMIYYYKYSNPNHYMADSESGIWRTPVAGGAETKIVSGPSLDGDWRSWDLSASGLYFLVVSRTGRIWSSPSRRVTYTLRFLDFATGRESDLFHREGIDRLTCLTISPDEMWALYAEVPVGRAELFLVDNFR